MGDRIGHVICILIRMYTVYYACAGYHIVYSTLRTVNTVCYRQYRVCAYTIWGPFIYTFFSPSLVYHWYSAVGSMSCTMHWPASWSRMCSLRTAEMVAVDQL